MKVDMGEPDLTASHIPIKAQTEQVIDEPIEVDGKTYRITGVSMGNPHGVVFLDDIDSLDIEKIGPSFENHVRFPDRINTEFVQLDNRSHVRMRVWERVPGKRWPAEQEPALWRWPAW